MGNAPEYHQVQDKPCTLYAYPFVTCVDDWIIRMFLPFCQALGNHAFVRPHFHLSHLRPAALSYPHFHLGNGTKGT
jgi:hypothetical protein